MLTRYSFLQNMLLTGTLSFLAPLGCCSQSPESEEVQHLSPTSVSGVYPLSIADQDMLIGHEDTNSDGRFQTADEALYLMVNGTVVDSRDRDFDLIRRQFALPDFASIDIPRWHRLFRQFFPNGCSHQQHVRFHEIEELYGESVDLAEAWEIAQTMQPETNDERLAAWWLVGFLSHLQFGGGGHFYAHNRDLIDSTLQRIRSGQLGIGFRDDPAVPDRIVAFGPAERVLLMPATFDPSVVVDRSAVIAELSRIHLRFQERTRPLRVMQDIEIPAYRIRAEYLINALGGTRSEISTEQVLEQLGNVLPDQLELEYAVRLAMAHLHNQPESVAEITRDFAGLLSVTYIARDYRNMVRSICAEQAEEIRTWYRDGLTSDQIITRLNNRSERLTHRKEQALDWLDQLILADEQGETFDRALIAPQYHTTLRAGVEWICITRYARSLPAAGEIANVSVATPRVSAPDALAFLTRLVVLRAYDHLYLQTQHMAE